MMNKKNILLLCSSLIFCLACRREHSASELDSICNQSLVSLHIDYYKNGILDRALSIDSIKKNSCNQVYRANGMGSTSNYINNLIDVDSIIIRYSDGTTIAHYGYFIQSGLNPKALQFSNARNLLNGQNWTSKSSKTKYSTTSELSFSITQQDYLDAQ